MIELELDGVFSVFKSREPTNDDPIERVLVVIIPKGKTWDTHCDSYSNNEST